MSALDNFSAWIRRGSRRNTRALAAPITFAPEARFTGLSSSTAQDPRVLLQEAIGWAAIAVGAIADRIAGIELEVCQRQRKNGRTILDPVDDHPLARMLRAGNPVHSARSLRRTAAWHLLVVGEAYFFKVRGQGLDVPVELWLGDPAMIRPLVSGGIISAFEVYDGEGARELVAAEDVVRAWWPDPRSLYTALGKLGPQWIAQDSLKFSGQTLRTHFESNAIPRVIMQATSESANASIDQIERLNAYFSQRFNRRNGSNAGLMAWSPFGFEPHELAALGGVEEVTAIIEKWVDQILASFGVPRSVLGLTDDAGLGRSTAETNDWIMDTRAVKPVCDTIADALTHQLAVPDFGDDVCVRFPDFAPADKDFELRRDETELRTKLRSVNQILERRGDEPVEWGDLPVGTIGEEPYSGEARDLLGPDDPTAFDTGGDEDPEAPEGDDGESQRVNAPSSSSSRSDAAVADASWARFIARERKFVPRAESAMISIFGIQERAALKVVRELDIRAQRAARIDDREILDALRFALGPERWRALFEKRFDSVRRLAYLEAGQDALALVGYDPSAFKLSQRTAELLAAQGEEFRRLVSSSTIKRLSDAVIAELASGAQAGESATTRAQRVEKAVSGSMKIRRNQALTIARTEMLSATQRAQIEGWRSTGVVDRKRWGTSRDDAVRDSHKIDGQTRGLEEAFLLPADADRKMNAELAFAPGVSATGGRLSAGNAIGCRCFVRPILEG